MSYYPLYFRLSNPGLASVTAKALNLFEWDGTGEMPTEIQNGKAFTPPAVISNETVIWSDSFTLDYTDRTTAGPVFFSDGAAGAAKVLEMINHVAGRLGQARFVDLPTAKAWIATQQGVDFVEPGAGTGTDYTETWSNGDVTYIFENNSAQSLTAWESTNSTGGSLLVGGVLKEYSAAAGTPWMPLLPGESFTATGLHRWNPSGTQLIADFQTWSSVGDRRYAITVNGVLLRTDELASSSFGSNYSRAGNVSLQAGDTVRVVVTNYEEENVRS